MRTLSVVAVTVIVATLGACVGDEPETIPPAGSSGTTGTTDGGPSTEAGSGAVGDAVTSDGFEDGCGRWHSSSSNLTKDATARSGPSSCRVCFSGAEASFDVALRHEVVLDPGSRYTATIWIRTAPDKPPGGSMLIGLRSEDAALSTIEEGASQGPPLTDTWQEATATLDVSKPGGSRLLLLVASQSVPDPGSCFLIDDAEIRRR